MICNNLLAFDKREKFVLCIIELSTELLLYLGIQFSVLLIQTLRLYVELDHSETP
jgi:hypothetical protein